MKRGRRSTASAGPWAFPSSTRATQWWPAFAVRPHRSSTVCGCIARLPWRPARRGTRPRSGQERLLLRRALGPGRGHDFGRDAEDELRRPDADALPVLQLDGTLNAAPLQERAVRAAEVL